MMHIIIIYISIHDFHVFHDFDTQMTEKYSTAMCYVKSNAVTSKCID